MKKQTVKHSMALLRRNRMLHKQKVLIYTMSIKRGIDLKVSKRVLRKLENMKREHQRYYEDFNFAIEIISGNKPKKK